MKLEKNSVFLLQGDSITDFYRTEPPINAQWHLLGRATPNMWRRCWTAATRSAISGL